MEPIFEPTIFYDVDSRGGNETLDAQRTILRVGDYLAHHKGSDSEMPQDVRTALDHIAEYLFTRNDRS